MLRADDEESLRRGVCAAFELAGYRAAHLRGSHGAADVRGASASFVVLPLTGEGEPSLLVESEGDFHAEELAVLSDLADDLHAWFVRRDRQSAFMAEHAAQEEQLRAARKTDDAARLAGGVAHDFNNLLSVIRMQVGETLMGASPELAEILSDIEAATDRAVELTRQLLILGGKQPLTPSPLDLNDEVKSMRSLIERTLGDHVTLSLTLDERCLRATADPSMLRQILVNFAVNARDAMPDGGTLGIETTERVLTAERTPGGLRAGHYVCLRVTDSGEAFAPCDLPHVFEPFLTTIDGGRRTGLGLAVVLGIVKRHGGTVSAQSEQGRGTTFEVMLPAALHVESVSSARPALHSVPR